MNKKANLNNSEESVNSFSNGIFSNLASIKFDWDKLEQINFEKEVLAPKGKPKSSSNQGCFDGCFDGDFYSDR